MTVIRLITVIAAVVAAGMVFTAAAVVSRPFITAPPADTVYLEELTWVEVREAIAAGKTVAIVPTGGIEQAGPHVTLGKHNYIVRYTAGKVAESLGNALVAPVIKHVPEGDIERKTGHMAFAGTISMPERVFAEILEYTARSLRAHGFRIISFLGDSGDNQTMQAAVADKLNAEWAGTGVTVLHVGDYYNNNGQMEWLLAQGETKKSVGYHAGIRDTSELLKVHPDGVRRDRVAPNGGVYREPTGVSGDPTQASAERGEKLLQLKIDTAVRHIRAAMDASGS